MNGDGGNEARTPPQALSAIGRALYETSLSTTSNLPSHKQQPTQPDGTVATTPAAKRERADSLKQMLPPPAAQRAKGKGHKPSPIVTANLDHAPAVTISSARGGDKSNPRRWSKVEDESLRLAVERSGERNWKAIADQVAGRNHTQCLQRWTKVLKPGLIKGHWTPEEDAKLRTLVAEGRKNWGQVASHIPGRTSKQCRERWCNHLDPNINKGNYTREEDQLIVDMQAKLGNRWSVIAQQLSGRTEDAVKIRWKSLMRTRRSSRGNEDDDDSVSDDVDDPSQAKPLSTKALDKLQPQVVAKARSAPVKPPPSQIKASSTQPSHHHPPMASSAPPVPTTTHLRQPPDSTVPHHPTYPAAPTGQTSSMRPPTADFLHEHSRPPGTPHPPFSSYSGPRHDLRQPLSSNPPFVHTQQFHPPSTSVYKSPSYPRMPFSMPPPPYPMQHPNHPYDPAYPASGPSAHPTLPPGLHHQLQPPARYLHPSHLPPSVHALPSSYRLHAAAAAREEWGTSHVPRSALVPNEASADYELFHQQRLRLMVQERERAGPTLSPAASPGQAMLTKELEANSERQKRQAIMQNGWKDAAAASGDGSLAEDAAPSAAAYIDQDDMDHHVASRYAEDMEDSGQHDHSNHHLAAHHHAIDDSPDEDPDDGAFRSSSGARHIVVALPPVE
ncbi:hypothetical protein, variant 1 [Aphanomyces invadans]|uniref:Uncharacterized protein n=1 Tax=Aphanomyces invadans TaxID=157072 RepID=A0A024UNQ5_9STRA|nr:hypothetical protein, variant 1 [Aphanomyces invadans]ETW07467.1 hypothetical protein, variant 1 [Aphanomyces invadans]|eukprot:XP_008863560.1 hypothetical protein, variant 1 [Aphanomyces invadans]